MSGISTITAKSGGDIILQTTNANNIVLHPTGTGFIYLNGTQATFQAITYVNNTVSYASLAAGGGCGLILSAASQSLVGIYGLKGSAASSSTANASFLQFNTLNASGTQIVAAYLDYVGLIVPTVQNADSDITVGKIANSVGGFVNIGLHNNATNVVPYRPHQEPSLSFGWNMSTSAGEVDFVNNWGGDGFWFYNRTSSTEKSLLAKISPNGLTVGSSLSIGAGGVITASSGNSATLTSAAGTSVILNGAVYCIFNIGGVQKGYFDSAGLNVDAGKISTQSTMYLVSGTATSIVFQQGTFTPLIIASFFSGGGLAGYQNNYHAAGVVSGSAYIQFIYDGNTIGGITQSGTTNISVNGVSDYRLKSNIKSIDTPLETLQKLKPCAFTWTNDNREDIGFIAHEFGEVFPDSVINQKDEIDEDGKPKYQQMSANVCIPLLVSCVQEQHELVVLQQTEIVDLKAQLALKASESVVVAQQAEIVDLKAQLALKASESVVVAQQAEIVDLKAQLLALKAVVDALVASK
jgi:hypothetical protein